MKARGNSRVLKTSVIAFDLATTTGWAWHAQGMPRPFFDAFTLPGNPGEVGRPADALERWILDIYDKSEQLGLPITHWFFEAQHVANKMNIDTIYRLITLGGIVEKIAWQKKPKGQTNAFCYKVHISEWRKHFIGRGGGFKKNKETGKYLPGEDPKLLAVERCRDYGWHTDIADAAEACGILDFGLSLIGDDVHPRPWRDDTIMKVKERA